jgi:lactam utilization protein B
MLVNFEVGALEKWIKSKGTDDPHVSHHGVFQPHAARQRAEQTLS